MVTRSMYANMFLISSSVNLIASFSMQNLKSFIVSIPLLWTSKYLKALTIFSNFSLMRPQK